MTHGALSFWYFLELLTERRIKYFAEVLNKSPINRKTVEKEKNNRNRQRN